MTVSNYLKRYAVGKDKAIKAPELLEALDIGSDAQLRELVNEERISGKPICSFARGYYYASSAKEAKECYTKLNKRASKIMKAANGLLLGGYNLEAGASQ